MHSVFEKLLLGHCRPALTIILRNLLLLTCALKNTREVEAGFPSVSVSFAVVLAKHLRTMTKIPITPVKNLQNHSYLQNLASKKKKKKT